MINTGKFLILLILAAFTFQSCEKNDDNDVPANVEVNDFVWKGLNLYYLWQADVPDLADNRFGNQSQLNSYLLGFSNAEDLFQNLLNKPISRFPLGEAVDRFSVIFDDYNELEGILSGTTKNNGADIALYLKAGSNTEIFGIVRYVLPNSDAAAKNVKRGMIFYAVNGQSLNRNNYMSLLFSSDTYTLNFADFADGNITPNGQSVSLTKSVLSENPVYLTKIIETGTRKVGYLMYNGFYPNYESQLNDAFAELKSAGITDFVLDLRYNGGGSIDTAARLASMITGQFSGQVFAKQQWNSKLQSYYEENQPETLYNYFSNSINSGAAINGLNMTKMYVLTTAATASASELVINGLIPYIDIIQIGDKTVGKNVGSITLYDSPTFSKQDISNNHRYAMQPLVLKIVNKVGFGDYINGLQPNIFFKEDLGNLGILGDSNEPYLNAAIERIIGSGRQIPQSPSTNFQNIHDNQIQTFLRNEMYPEKVPAGFFQ